MKKTSKTFDLNGKTLTLETGKLTNLATASVLGRLGDTMVLATVVMSKDDTKLDYFPLFIEYVERLYAGGKIKGSRWVKREGKPSDDAILTARLIDRSVRPLFPKEFKKEVQVVVTVLSVDGENDPSILSMITTSAALAISKIPWDGPVGAVRVGMVKEEGNGKHELVINPDNSENEFLDLDMVVTASKNDNTVMVEAGAKEISEDVALEAIKTAKEWDKKIIAFINELVKEVGEKKVEVTKDTELEEIIALVEKSYKDKISAIIDGGIGENVSGELSVIADNVGEIEEGKDKKKILSAVDYVFKKIVRENILKNGKRTDGRRPDEVRKISSEVGLLPRTHGSGLFQRGETQALSVATLGSSSLEQLIESAEGEETKRYMHHYSFPPYSVGETGRVGFPSRREIGHGALAERALEAVIPPESVFPYTIRIVSEVMSSNGSTSMASTCGSTLALMDAGVPITAPVAGIAIGLMTDKSSVSSKKEKDYVILTDIVGLEDFSGDMDFKVAGTKNGITAIQLDVKLDGLTNEMIKEVLEKGRIARLSILETMLAALPESRREVSEYAPKIKVIKIDPAKIGGVIGPGGKIIKNIISTTGAEVDVEDDGSVSISSIDEAAVEKASEWVESLTRDVEVGETFEGTVKRMLAFGAFVEILPGKEGMVHVSQMSTEFVKSPEDVIKIGESVKVRVKEIDDQGRINLSMLFGEDAEKGSQRRDERGPRRESTGSRGPRREGFSRGPKREESRPFGNAPHDRDRRSGRDDGGGARKFKGGPPRDRAREFMEKEREGFRGKR